MEQTVTSVLLQWQLSGVGIIIGKETGKILFLGVRNKYCSSCARNIPADKHQCYRNWSASSSEMETDIILEGFLEAERVHGVRYTKFVGDGDSSVYPTLLQNVPGWGHAIQKLKCPIMHVSATGVHSSASSRTTPPTRAVAVSQQR